MTRTLTPTEPLPEGHVVLDDDVAGRAELRVDGELVAFADRSEADGVVTMPHTVTIPAHRGNGYAGKLVGVVLDDLAARGLAVRPLCWYVAQWLDERPDHPVSRVA